MTVLASLGTSLMWLGDSEPSPAQKVQASVSPLPQAKEAAPESYVPSMTYAVASIRESLRSFTAGTTMGGEASGTKCMLHVLNFDIDNLLTLAYHVYPARVLGLPAWHYSALFDIEAKCDEAQAASFALLPRERRMLEYRHMAEDMLATRFALKTHWEMRDGPTYELVVVKRGKLQESRNDPPSAEELKRFGDRPVPALYQRTDGAASQYVAHGVSMGDLARMLTAQMGRPVIDKTLLTAKWDFVLNYSGSTELDRKADDPNPAPPLDRAIQDQLGLKLQPSKGASPQLIIDHIEKPSPN